MTVTSSLAWALDETDLEPRLLSYGFTRAITYGVWHCALPPMSLGTSVLAVPFNPYHPASCDAWDRQHSTEGTTQLSTWDIQGGMDVISSLSSHATCGNRG